MGRTVKSNGIIIEKLSEASEYFVQLIDRIGNNKIKCVFTQNPFYNDNNPRLYDTDDSLYIVFENDMCIVIDYWYVSYMVVEYRKMNADEHSAVSEAVLKDLFNYSIDFVREEDDIENLSSELEYDALSFVEVRKQTHEYEEWISHSVETVSPGPETFGELLFHMKNGNTIAVYAGDAIDGGTTYIFSDDAVETTRKRNKSV